MKKAAPATVSTADVGRQWSRPRGSAGPLFLPIFGDFRQLPLRRVKANFNRSDDDDDIAMHEVQ